MSVLGYLREYTGGLVWGTKTCFRKRVYSGDDISSVTNNPIGSNSHDAKFFSRNEVEISEDSTELETADQIIVDDEVEVSEKKKSRIQKKHARSEVWKFFEVFKEMKYKSWAFCSLCLSNVYYTDTMST